MKKNIKLIWLITFFLIVLTLNVSGASNLTFSSQVLAGYHFTSATDVVGLNNISGVYGTLTTDKNGVSNQAYNYAGGGSDNIPYSARFNLNESFGMMLWTTKNNANSGLINKGPLTSDYGSWSIGNDRFYFYGSAYSNTYGLDGSWHMLWMEFNKTSQTLCTSKDNGASTCSSVPQGNLLGAHPIYIGCYYSSGFCASSKIDEWIIYNGTITATQRTEYYNLYDNWSLGPTGGGGGGSSPTISFTTPPSPTNNSAFYLKNESLTINASITSGSFNISLRIFNSTGANLYTNTSNDVNSLQTTINTNTLNFPTGVYYFNATFLNATYNNFSETRAFYLYNITLKGINSPSNNQIVNTQSLNLSWNASTINPTGTSVSINTYNVSLRNSDSSLNRSIVSTSNLSFLYNFHLQNLSLGIYGLRVESIDSNGNVVYQENAFNYTKNANLTITLVNAYNGSAVTSNGSLTLLNNLTGLIENFNVINGRTSFDIVKNTTYSLTFNVSGYAITNTNYITNSSTFQTANLSLYTNNSVYIHIYDETTGNPIYSNVTITFTGLTTSVYTTNTSELFVSDLRDGNWSVSFYGTNYSLKTYLITVGAQSFQTLNAFLTDSSNAVIFTIKDFDSSVLLEGASISQYRRINATWTLIDTRTSDITARAQFYYVPTVEYQFVVSLANYQSESFELNPILFSSYDIRLHKTTTLTPANTPSGTGMSITYSPIIFYNNLTNNFTWNIVSPVGSLVNYNLNLLYPSGNQSFSGSNAIGEQINTNFVINGANLTSQVLIGYCYEITTSGLYCFNYSYNIISVTANNTFIGNSNNTYGLGTWERVLIMTLIVIVVTAVAYAFAGLIVGLTITLFLYLYFFYIGFVPLWSVAIPLFFGIMYVLFSGGKR